MELNLKEMILMVIFKNVLDIISHGLLLMEYISHIAKTIQLYNLNSVSSYDVFSLNSTLNFKITRTSFYCLWHILFNKKIIFIMFLNCQKLSI